MNYTKPNCKILITNIVSLNTGDAAILWGTMEILRQRYGSKTNIIVFDKNAKVAQNFYPWAYFRQSLFSRPTTGVISQILKKLGYSHWIKKIQFLRYFICIWLLKNHLFLLAKCFVKSDELIDLKEYVSADLILSTGGTYLIENYNLDSAKMDYRLSIATAKPFGFFTQTLGPFKQPINKKIFSKIFSNASVILLRDQLSKSHILELGVSTKNIYLAADAAFILSYRKKTTELNQKNVGPLKLAISVRSMKFFHSQNTQKNHLSYFEGIVLAVKVAVEEFGAEITFLSTCQGIPEYWTNDANTAGEIFNMLPENIRQHVNIDRKFRQPWEIVDTYHKFDAVIATRMHAAILSLCAGTPTLGIAYEFKMEELFKNIKMPELVLSVEKLSEDGIKSCVQKLISQRYTYAAYVKIAAEKKCKEAWLAEHALPEIHCEKLL